jgi:hypothetical protein
MKNKTAVEWLNEAINKKLKSELGPSFTDLFNEAKKIEREQIINAYDEGTFYLKGEIYYRKTFEDESGI